jgi:hypothetical protein
LLLPGNKLANGRGAPATAMRFSPSPVLLLLRPFRSVSLPIQL